MAEVNTFSALIDDAARRTGRPQAKSGDLISFARLTIRECQKKVNAYADLVEDLLTADASPYVWTQPQYFRKLVAAKYPGIYTQRNRPVYPRLVSPGKVQDITDYFYYYTADSIAFNGLTSGDSVAVAYLTWSRKFPYYDSASRPATFDLETETWTYLTAVTAAEQETARSLVTNWLLFDWYDLILEGTCTKMWKSINDPRATSSYALYKQLQTEMADEISDLSVSNPDTN